MSVPNAQEHPDSVGRGHGTLHDWDPVKFPSEIGGREEVRLPNSVGNVKWGWWYETEI